MTPEKIDRYKCEECPNIEDVPVGQRPKIMNITVVGHEHLWCPNCVYAMKSLRKHVNEDHLRLPLNEKSEGADKTVEFKELMNGMQKRMSKHLPMEHLNSQTNEITSIQKRL